jgi:hypothetical protein
MPLLQDFTIFSPTNDLVPLLGAADINGNVLTDSFSTDPANARPYLKLVQDAGESSVDFISGGSVIGQMQVEVIDFPTIPGDQTSGIMTQLLADAGGDTQLLGCRGVLRQFSDVLGAWEVIFDGVIGTIELDMGTFVTYRIQLRDARERERKLRCFDYATTTCIFPRVGPANGWGFPTQYAAGAGHLEIGGEPAMPAVIGLPMRFHGTGGGDGVFVLEVADSVLWQMVELTAKYGDIWKNWGEALWIPAAISGKPLDAWCHPNILIEWRASETGVWQVANSPNDTTILTSFRDMDTNAFIIGPVSQQDTRSVIKAIVCESDGSTVQPADGALVYVRVRSNREPTKEVPLFLEENFGWVLKDIYDGKHSLSIVMPVRYDTAAMNAMILNTPKAMALIEGPVDDGREWVQENIYKICGYAPATRNGLVYPIKYEIPDATVPLLALDDSNIIASTWLHGPDNVINDVTIEYQRSIVPTNVSSGLAELQTQQVVIQRDRINSLSRNGSKTLAYKPVTLRNVIPQSAGFTTAIGDETGTVLGLKRAEEMLRRFTMGAQVCEIDVVVNAATLAAKEGDWAQVSPSWLPDYVTHKRGMNRLMQITKIHRTTPNKRTFSVVDSGPYDVPVTQPTQGALTVNADRSVSVAVNLRTTPPGTKAEVNYALSPTLPDPLSGEWKMAGVPIAILSKDPTTSDPSEWLGGVSVVTIGDGVAGTHAIRSVVGAYTNAIASTAFPIDRKASYRLHAWARKSGDADGVLYTGVQVLDAAGANISGNGTYWYVGAVANSPVGGTPMGPWTEYNGDLGIGGLMGGFPPNAVSMRLIALMNYVTPSAGYYEIQDFYIATAGGLVARTPPGLPQSKTVWLRTRGTADGRRSSAWTAPGSIVIPATPLMRDYQLSIGTVADNANWGAPRVAWERLPSTIGLRILYKVYNATDPDPGAGYAGWSFLDVDASAGGSAGMNGAVFLPVVLKQWQKIMVELDPYSGFAGGAVTGVLGPVSFRKTVQRHDTTYMKPSFNILVSETATLGSLQVNSNDPQLQVTQVETYTQSGNAAPGAWTVSGGPPYGNTVALADGQPSYIGYRVTGYDADGNLGILQEDVMPFAVGDYPQLVDVDLSVDPAGGALVLNWTGDSNTTGVKYIASTSGYVSAATVRGQPLTVGRTGSVSAGSITPGQTVYITVLAYNGTLESTQLYQYQEARPILTGTIPPGIQETTFESPVGTLSPIGSVTINATDPQLRVTGAKYRYQIGDSAWSAMSGFFSLPVTFSTFLAEGHISKIEYEIYADMGSGSVLYYRGSVAFSTGSIPNAPQLIMSFDDGGSLRVLFIGDSDTHSMRLGASTVSLAAANSAALAATAVNQRVTEYVNVLTGINSGQLVWVVGYAYPGTGGTGTASTPGQMSLSREGAGTKTPTQTVTKILRVHGSQFMPQFFHDAASGVDSLQVAGNGIIYSSASSLGLNRGNAYVGLPPGVTVTAMRANWNPTAPGSATETLNLTLLDAGASGGTQTTIASISDSASPGTGWRTPAATVSVALGTNPLIIQCLFNTLGVLLGYVEIEYVMPSYDKTI